MLGKIAKQVNRALKPVGVQFQRTSVPEPRPRLPDALSAELQDIGTDLGVHWQRYQQVVRELHGALTTYQFPTLPPNDQRERLLARLLGTEVSEAMWILNGLHCSLSLPGDVCEFGTAHGATAALIASEIRATDKGLWLFDSFQGLSKPTAKDELIDDIFQLGSIDAYEGAMGYSSDVVKAKLAALSFPASRTHIVPGFIEHTIHAAGLPQQVCFAYVDFDFYEPILIALNFLAKVLSPGGQVVVDDYQFFSSGVKTAVDEFLATHGASFTLELPPDWAGHFAVLHKSADAAL